MEAISLKSCQYINGTVLKLIAIFTMLIDHIGAVLFPQYLFLRIIGRIAFPIFIFLMVEGFIHTRNIRNYEMRMILFAVLSEIPFDLAFWNNPVDWSHQNVFLTLALGLILLDLIEKYGNAMWKQMILLLIFMLAANFLQTDYSAGGVLLIYLFYLFRTKKLSQLLSLGIVSFVFFGWLECFSVLAFFPICLYNGKKGFQKKDCMDQERIDNRMKLKNGIVKYFFYAFYPVHLLILYGISNL